MISIAWGQTPEENVAILRDKGYKLSFFYDEVNYEAHRRAFTVAKMMRMDLLQDMHESLVQAQQSGAGFKEWKKNIIPTLQKKGWWGEQDIVNPETGEVKTINIGSRRLRTIFDTNMRMSREIARCREQKLLVSSVFWRYVSKLLPTTRENHRARHGVTLHRDHPWWKKNRAPNGYGCVCTVTAHSESQIKKRGWKISEEAPDDIFDEGWDHSPCEDGGYTAEQQYFEKVQSVTCKKAFARTRTVLCPYEDIIRESYKSDMMQMLPGRDEWKGFVDRALDTEYKRHEKMRLGYLSFIEPLHAWLEKRKPQSDLILADTGAIRNLKAKGEESVGLLKKKAEKNTLSTEDIYSLLDIIHEPVSAYYDGHLLLIFELSSKAKVVVGVDIGDKKNVFHSVHSGQLYETDEALNTALEGKEKIF